MPATKPIRHVHLLGYGRLKARQTADGLIVKLPAQPVNDIAPVLRIKKIEQKNNNKF
jgi:alpha-L-fucosidase